MDAKIMYFFTGILVGIVICSFIPKIPIGFKKLIDKLIDKYRRKKNGIKDAGFSLPSEIPQVDGKQ